MTKTPLVGLCLCVCLLAATAVPGVQAAGINAAGGNGTAGQKKVDFQTVVTQKKQVVMEWVRDITERKKKTDLESSLADLDWATLKALDQQLTFEWQQYVKKPEAQTPEGVRILGRFKQAQTIIRDMMAKRTPPAVK